MANLDDLMEQAGAIATGGYQSTVEAIYGAKWYENKFGAGTFNTTHPDTIIVKTLHYFKHLDYDQNSATTAINRIQGVSRMLTFQARHPSYQVAPSRRRLQALLLSKKQRVEKVTRQYMGCIPLTTEDLRHIFHVCLKERTRVPYGPLLFQDLQMLQQCALPRPLHWPALFRDADHQRVQLGPGDRPRDGPPHPSPQISLDEECRPRRLPGYARNGEGR
jgi:hypothetical protein